MKAILAVDKNNGIGYKNSLPWDHLKEDLNFFRKTTIGKTVVMGYNTWVSLNFKKLPNRTNIVISSKSTVDGDYDALYSDIETAMMNHFDEEMYVIGGNMLLSYCMKYHISEIFVNRVNSEYKCDTYFDETNLRDFELVSSNILRKSDPEIIAEHYTLKGI